MMTTGTASNNNNNLTKQVSFPSADKTFNLYGNLTLPGSSSSSSSEAGVPAIVIVAGSGPIDRDGNVPGMFGLKINTSNRFAEHFGSNNNNNSMNPAIAILSYDKRGTGKSLKKGHPNLYYEAGLNDLVSDAVEAVRYLQQQHEQIDASKIIVMGHSEGAIMMPLISRGICHASNNNNNNGNNIKPLFGAIFLAGFGENVLDAMKAQQNRALEEVQHEKGINGRIMRFFVTKKRVDKQYEDMMKKIKENDNDISRMYFGMVKIPAKWFREHEAYSPKANTTLGEEMKCHCLAITGLKDAQVNPQHCNHNHASELVPLAASVESHTPKNLTHALRSLDDDTVSKLLEAKQEYARMGKLPLDAEMLDIIDKWCRRILKAPTTT